MAKFYHNFPAIKRSFKQETKRSEVPEVYCTCCLPEGGERMIACDNCGEWYHESCLNSVISSEAWTDCIVTSGHVIFVSYMQVNWNWSVQHRLLIAWWWQNLGVPNFIWKWRPGIPIFTLSLDTGNPKSAGFQPTWTPAETYTCKSLYWIP